jgi:prepilin-type N-terminal cleavage/methylation domain-containing protein
MTRHSAFAKFRFPLRTTRGVTLIELMIVFVIIGIMLSFLFPAIQAVRQSSLRTSCQNNRHNLEIAIENYIAATKRFPGPPIEDRPSGWAIEILPYVEAQAWKDRFLLNLPLSDPSNLQAGGGRPDVFRCPLVVVTDSAVPGIPTAHYTLAVDQTTRGKNAKKVAWRLRDASVGTRLPWCLGPEVTFHDPYEHPHPAPESGLGSLVGD